MTRARAGSYPELGVLPTTGYDNIDEVRADAVGSFEPERPSSIHTYWHWVAVEYPYLSAHAREMAAFVDGVDGLILSGESRIDFHTAERWYRLHDPLEYCADRVPLLLRMSEVMEVSSWSAHVMRGNLLHEAALLAQDPFEAIRLLRQAKDDYSILKDQPVSNSLVRRALVHWHDAEIEIARLRHQLKPERYGGQDIVKKHLAFINACVERIEHDTDKIAWMTGNTRKGHIANLGGDAWEMFGILADNDVLIQRGHWRDRIARHAFWRQDEPRYDLDERDQEEERKKLGIRRLGVDIVVAGSAGVLVNIQMKSGGSSGRAYDERIQQILARYKDKRELIEDILVSLDVMRMAYTPDVETSVRRTYCMRHLRELAGATTVALAGCK